MTLTLRRRGSIGSRTRRRRRKLSKSETAKYEALSPFELKNVLIKKAEGHNPGRMMNAGRGNPNFFNTFVRIVAGRLQIACTEASTPFRKDLALYPNENTMDFARKMKEISYDWPADQRDFLMNYVDYLSRAARKNGLGPDAIVHDLFISALGTFYPSPPQIQPHLNLVAQDFMFDLVGAKANKSLKPSDFEYFATEGAAAGILYVFNTLRANYILTPGDTIAVVVPIFSPYLEMPYLKGPEGYNLNIVELRSTPETDYGLPQSEINKLLDPKIKALFMVNPANPGAFSLSKQDIDAIGNIVNTKRQDLVVLSDNVYAPFADKYHSFMTSCPRNTIEVFSLSKFFGTTGCRLGIAMVAKNNRFLDIIKKLPAAKQNALSKRYDIASMKPRDLSFMERLVMDSRQVAEAHVGGLSTPQQVMIGMMFFYYLHDTRRTYTNEIKRELRERIELMYDKLGLELDTSPEATNYYNLIDLLEVARSIGGEKAVEKFKKRSNYLDYLFRLASEYHIVLLPGAGFGANQWRVRVSLANLPKEDYGTIGTSVRKCVQSFIR